MPDKDIRNTILHIYIKNQERAFATLLSPHYAVCSCKAVTLDNKFNVDGYGNLKDNGNAVAECIFVNKEYNFQVLKMAQQAPDSSISCIHHDFKGLTNPNSLLKTYWYSSRKKTFEELPAFTKNFGGYATHKEFIEISLSDEKGYFDITSTLGTPVLYQSGELVGIFADEPETKEGLFSIVPILDIIIVGRWFDDLVLSDYNNWKNKNDDTEQASSSASTTSSESTQRKNTAAKDYRKEYIEILRQCSETPNHEYLDEQAKYAYELKLGGYVTAAEILDNGHPVQVMVMNVTPSGREYLSRLEKEIAAQDIEISSRDESHSSNSGSSSEAIDDTDSDSASSDVTDGTTTEGVKIDPNPVVPGRPSDNEIESAKINVSRDEFTDSSFFILTNAFGLATVTGEGWGDEKHLLVEGLWVGITKETVIKNPYSSFTTLIEALGLETEDKLIDFLHDRKLLPDTTGLDILRFFNDGAVSQSPVNIPFSHNAIKIINRARDIAQETAKDKKAYQVHQRHLLTALVLSFKESTILNTAFSGFEQKIVAAIIKDISVHYSNLKSDDPSGWSKIRILVEAEFRSPGPKIPPGKNTSISRDARADETCLNAEAYVKVLKSLLKGVSGEFCMGLFAPWGRGKTYLIKLLSKSLENEKERNYQVIKFSCKDGIGLRKTAEVYYAQFWSTASFRKRGVI
jgi:hypothetical protein